MHRLETFLNAEKMAEVIFNACRANETREPKRIDVYTVVFKQLEDNTHRVHVREGTTLCAVAVVDKYDV